MGNFAGRVMHRHITSKLEDNKGVLALVLLGTAVAFVVRLCVKHPRTSITVAALGYVYLAAGWRSLAEAGCYAVIALAVWWACWRESFRAVVVPVRAGLVPALVPLRPALASAGPPARPGRARTPPPGRCVRARPGAGGRGRPVGQGDLHAVAGPPHREDPARPGPDRVRTVRARAGARDEVPGVCDPTGPPRPGLRRAAAPRPAGRDDPGAADRREGRPRPRPDRAP